MIRASWLIVPTHLLGLAPFSICRSKPSGKTRELSSSSMLILLSGSCDPFPSFSHLSFVPIPALVVSSTLPKVYSNPAAWSHRSLLVNAKSRDPFFLPLILDSYLSSETQGPVSWGREERRDKRFQAWAEEPLGTDSCQTISKQSGECWLLIGLKKCFVLLCPISKQHFQSSFCVFTHDGYCLAILVRFVDDSGKCFRCYHQDHSNLHWENSVSDQLKDIVSNTKAWSIQAWLGVVGSSSVNTAGFSLAIRSVLPYLLLQKD